MASAQKLKALVHAKAFAVEAYRAVRQFPREEQAVLGDQIRRAVTSAVLNIAEGASRTSYRDYRRFLDTSRASLKEASVAIELAHAVDCVETSTFARLEAHGDEASRTLYGLMRYVDGCIKEGKTQRAL